MLSFPAGISALADSFFAYPESTNHKDNPALRNEAKSPSAAGNAEKQLKKTDKSQMPLAGKGQT